MLRTSFHFQLSSAVLTPHDRRKCQCMAYTFIVQCVLVYVASFTILNCVWTPEGATEDYDKLPRIMYLYDYKACKYKLKTAKALANIRLSNETHGLPVLPVKWKRAELTVAARLASKTRRYIEASLGMHVTWMIVSICFIIIVSRNCHLVIKISLFIFFYTTVAMLIFDLSMAFVYIGHIQQSITKSMVLRYSGWSVELKLNSYEDYAVWIPIMASAMWLRGIFIFAWNIYCCKFIYSIREKVRKREVKKKMLTEGYLPIPESKHDQLHMYDKSVLYYRTGEYQPAAHDQY